MAWFLSSGGRAPAQNYREGNPLSLPAYAGAGRKDTEAAPTAAHPGGRALHDGPVRHRPLQITEYGVYCTTQARYKLEAPAPEIAESGSENGPAPLRRLPAPAATTYVPGVRPR